MSKMKLKKHIEISKSDKIIIIIAIVFFFTFVRIKTFSVKSNTILLNYAKNQSTKIATTIINTSLKEVIDDEFDDIMKIRNDDNGIILGIDFDSKKSNELNYKINENILSNIKLFETGQINNLNLEYLDNTDYIYKVPIGIIYDIPILVDITAKVPFKISLLSNVESSVSTQVKEYGINNSLIEICINVILNVQIILPFSSETVKINKKIPIDSKIVQGKIPQYYGGLLSNAKS